MRFYGTVRVARSVAIDGDHQRGGGPVSGEREKNFLFFLFFCGRLKTPPRCHSAKESQVSTNHSPPSVGLTYSSCLSREARAISLFREHAPCLLRSLSASHSKLSTAAQREAKRVGKEVFYATDLSGGSLIRCVSKIQSRRISIQPSYLCLRRHLRSPLVPRMPPP